MLFDHLDVAVIGVPDERWGERVVAVKPGRAPTLEGLQAFAETRLARYKLPRELRLVDALPRSPTGKVLKQQYRTAMPEASTVMDRLIERLAAALPHEVHTTVLLHGDSRLDNLMFDRDADRVITVLDWELSTLGHPLADLGQFLAVMDLPPDYLLPGLAGVDRAAQGLPDEARLADRYFRAMSMEPHTDLRFHKAFAMFRQAAKPPCRPG